MLLKHFQFSGITKPGHDKWRPAKIPQNIKNNLISKIVILVINIKKKFQICSQMINYFLYLVIDLSKKDFHELERLEYQKRFI